jgi:hypothetical protein
MLILILRRTSSQQSVMMQAYLQSEATVTERIGMGGEVEAANATGDHLVKEAARAIEDFDKIWESAKNDSAEARL